MFPITIIDVQAQYRTKEEGGIVAQIPISHPYKENIIYPSSLVFYFNCDEIF